MNLITTITKLSPRIKITSAVLMVGVLGTVLYVQHQSTHSSFGGKEVGISLHKDLLHKVTTLPDMQQTEVAKAPSMQPTATVASPCGTSVTSKLLLVSISKQHIWACDGTNLVRESAVTTGASALANVDDATPVGTWRIYAKQTNLHLRGTDANGNWDDPVSYWMPYDGAVGFHDSSWQTFPYGSELYKTQGSHGCVHLPIDMAAWVYSWAPVGTTVTVRA